MYLLIARLSAISSLIIYIQFILYITAKIGAVGNFSYLFGELLN